MASSDRRRASTGSVAATPSRHIDFRGVSQDDDDAWDDAPASSSSRRVSFGGVEQAPARYEREWSDDEVSTGTSSPARQRSPGTPPSRRRKVVHWTLPEEQFIIQGVKKYGLGQWRRILEDGADVFLPQRTNVDLKDKWKNLVRKVALTPEEEEMADTRIWRETVAARTIGKMLPDLLQQVDDEIEDDNEEYDDAARAKKRRRLHGTEALQFFVGTDATAPHLRSVTIVPRDCPTVATLKRVLSRRLLDDAPLPTNLQLVSIHTRRLLGDLESVEECAARDGHELYLLHDP